VTQRSHDETAARRSIKQREKKKEEKKRKVREYHFTVSTNVTVRCHRTNTKRQVAKGTRWMPRHREAKKDAATGETPRGAGSMLRSVDVRMGKPSGSHVPLLRKES
jgi:hypothetical protein